MSYNYALKYSNRLLAYNAKAKLWGFPAVLFLKATATSEIYYLDSNFQVGTFAKPTSDGTISGAYSSSLNIVAAVAQGGKSQWYNRVTDSWVDGTLLISFMNWTVMIWANFINSFVVFDASTATSAQNVATSTDGKIWTYQTIDNVAWLGADSNNSIIVAVATNRITTSTDGSTWTNRTIPATVTPACVHWSSLISQFIIGDLINGVTLSSDGITWSSKTSTSLQHLKIASNNSVILSLVISGGNAIISSSTNGTSWTATSLSLSDANGDLKWSPKLNAFIVTEQNTSNAYYSTNNGVSWTTINKGFSGSAANMIITQ